MFLLPPHVLGSLLGRIQQCDQANFLVCMAYSSVDQRSHISHKTARRSHLPLHLNWFESLALEHMQFEQAMPAVDHTYNPAGHLWRAGQRCCRPLLGSAHPREIHIQAPVQQVRHVSSPMCKQFRELFGATAIQHDWPPGWFWP